MQIKPIALAAALALAAPLAHAGNITFIATPIEIVGGGYARSLNDHGEVAVWAATIFPNSYLPRVWSGSPVAQVIECCLSNGYAELPLFIDNAGQVFGQADVPALGMRGMRLNPATGVTGDLGAGHLPTGRGPDGSLLSQFNGNGAVVAGSVVTFLPVPAGATRAWGYAAAGGVVVGKVAIGGLGHAASFHDGAATLLHNGPSAAYDVNAQGQWVGFTGTGANTQAVLGGLNGVRVLQGPTTLSDQVAISLNEAGQVLAGSGLTNGTLDRPTAHEPFLYGNGRATRLQDVVPFATVAMAMDMNEDGQILAGDGAFNPMLLTPQGTLAWAGTGGGRFTDAEHWDSGLGFAPNRFLDVRYDSAASQGVWLDRDARMLSFSMGSGTGRTTLDLQRGALLRADNGMAIEANGVLSGDGRVQTPWFENRGRIAATNLSFSGSGFGVDGSVYNQGLISGLPGEGATLRVGWLQNGFSSSSGGIVPGRLRMDAGQSLRVEGDVVNYGAIEVFGGSFSHAGPGPLVTAPADLGNGNFVVGRILARDATLRFDNGLQLSSGQLAFSGGVSDVFGRVELIARFVATDPESQVIVSGRGEVTFWDAVHNNGELRVSAGSTATFFGLVSGAGRFTGSGTKYLEGGFAPGNSPALVTIEGDLSMGASSRLMMELGGTVPGTQHDKLDVLGTLTLAGGPLQVVWWGGFQAGAGDRFDLLDWGALEGSFGAISLPTLGTGLLWDTSALYTLGELRVAAVPEPAAASLLLAGLVALGWVARRRSSAQAAH